MTNRQVQIPERLFRLLLAYHIEHIRNDEIEAQINAALSEKLDRIARRVDYRDNLSSRQKTRA